jgi:hypothetical protein
MQKRTGSQQVRRVNCENWRGAVSRPRCSFNACVLCTWTRANTVRLRGMPIASGTIWITLLLSGETLAWEMSRNESWHAVVLIINHSALAENRLRTLKPFQCVLELDFRDRHVTGVCRI